eukprot:495265_1
MSLSKTFIKAKFEFKFYGWLPKPSYHPQNPEIYTYDQTFIDHYPSGHGQFIDSKNELLYIFGGDDSKQGQIKFGVFDLNTKKMNTDTESALSNCGECPQSTYIPSPINECHILSNHSIHYK